MNEKLKEKVKEALSAILPITLIVTLVCLFVTPVSSDVMVMFFVGAVLLIFGIGLFSLGADTSMSIIGERIGASLSKSKKIWIIALISFIVGTITTVAEPDLQVLATQMTQIPSYFLVVTVAVGVGVFLAIAMLRIVFKVKLSTLLLFLYVGIFILSFFVPSNFLPIAFDSGGVTTGPMTVPFIIALGIGAASIRNDKDSESDSFGLVALCSVGPIIAVMILGLLFKIDGASYVPIEYHSFSNSQAIGRAFIDVLPKYSIEVLKSLLPIVVFFAFYNHYNLKLSTSEIEKIFIGFIYTFLGLVIFLTGVNVGFLPVGNTIGMSLINSIDKTLVLPLIMLIGYFIVKAEPAVQILTKQVSDITDGMVSEKVMMNTLSIGMMVALILSLFRAWYGIPFFAILVPGYIIALGLTFFAPEIFIGIAFDSGGVTSGPMTASFILPLMIGICEASGRANIDVMKDAFGLVSMVALMPLIVIQTVGVMFKIQQARGKTVLEEISKDEADEIIVFKRKAKQITD